VTGVFWLAVGVSLGLSIVVVRWPWLVAAYMFVVLRGAFTSDGGRFEAAWLEAARASGMPEALVERLLRSPSR